MCFLSLTQALGLRPEDTFSAEMLSRALQDTFASSPAHNDSGFNVFGGSDSYLSVGSEQASRTFDASTDDDMML